MIQIAQPEQGVGIEQEFEVVHVLVFLGPGRQFDLSQPLVELAEDFLMLGLFLGQEHKHVLEFRVGGGLDQTVVKDLAARFDFLGSQENVRCLEYSRHKTSYNSEGSSLSWA